MLAPKHQNRSTFRLFGELISALFSNIVDMEVPPSLDGCFFLPTLFGKAKEQKEHDISILGNSMRKVADKLFESGNWKAVKSTDCFHRRDSPIELL